MYSCCRTSFWAFTKAFPVSALPFNTDAEAHVLKQLSIIRTIRKLISFHDLTVLDTKKSPDYIVHL